MKYILTVIGILTLSRFAQAKSMNIAVGQLGALYCQGNIQEILKIANAAKPSDEHYIAARLSSLYDDSTLSNVISSYDDAMKKITKLSEVDRLYYADASARAHYGTIENLETLANFKSSSDFVEAYRIALEGDIALIKGNYHLAAIKYRDAFDRNPYFNSTFLTSFFRVAQLESNPEDLMVPYYSYVNQLSDSGSKNFLLAIIAKAKKGKELPNYYSHIKQAHEICPRSQSFAFEYAYSLLLQRDTLGAERALLGITTSRKYYSAILDLYLARIYFRMHDFPRAEQFIEHASENDNLSDVRGQTEIARWKKDGERLTESDDLGTGAYSQDDTSKWLIYGMLGAMFILIGVLFIRVRKNKYDPPSS